LLGVFDVVTAPQTRYVRRRAARRISVLAGLLLATAAACTPSAGPDSDLPTFASIAGDEECQDVRARPGPIAAQVALGYASTEYRFDERGELWLCLKGLANKTVTVDAPEGVEVAPSKASSGPIGIVVLRFTIRVQPKAHGALSIEIRSSTNRLSVRPAFGPMIKSSASGWRIVP
jgi:hypothetical protein